MLPCPLCHYSPHFGPSFPTGNLDTGNTRAVMDLFQTLNNDGMTIVMVTHSHECARDARRILHISDGFLIEDKPVHNMA